jgi:adenylate cyclase
MVLFLVAIVSSAYLVTSTFMGIDSGFVEFALDKGSGVVYAYIIIFDNFMLLVRQVNLMLGEGNLTRILTGRFYVPFEEERIFMFLDLQSSTVHAEKLGHIQYSQLLQDCFNDLSVIDAYLAEVYQYVGDEAVISWKYNEGLNDANCIRAFFAFKERIENRADHYQTKYGLVPVFKAGVNCGKVTTTEVGRYKREIAYHGDVLNTAARIQAKCNELNEELLVSKAIHLSLKEEAFRFDHKGEIPLRGKRNPLTIFSVHED